MLARAGRIEMVTVRRTGLIFNGGIRLYSLRATSCVDESHDKGFQLVRYYGWYSNKARGVRAKTGAAQAEDSAQGHEPDRAPTSAQWRRLIAVGEEAVDLPRLRAEMRILAFIEDRVIGRILRHFGLLRRLARSAAPEPVSSRCSTMCPPWKRERRLPVPSERPKSLRRRPGLPGARRHPEAKNAPDQREAPKTRR